MATKTKTIKHASKSNSGIMKVPTDGKTPKSVKPPKKIPKNPMAQSSKTNC